MKATKTQICNKYIEEADKIISLMNALKTYCNQVIIDEELEECGGYRGDGANDPNNRPNKVSSRTNAILQNIVVPAEKQANQNDFIYFNNNVSNMLITILKEIDYINFPDGMFENKADIQQPHVPFENPRIIEIRSREDLFDMLRFLIAR